MLIPFRISLFINFDGIPIKKTTKNMMNEWMYVWINEKVIHVIYEMIVMIVMNTMLCNWINIKNK